MKNNWSKISKKMAWMMAAILVFLTVPAASAEAAEFHQAGTPIAHTSSRIVYQQDGIVVEEELIVYEETSVLTRAAKTKSASKNYYIKDSGGKTLAKYTLHGTFSYNGSSATCTKASYDTSVSNVFWSFSSASATKSGSSAKGSFTAKRALSSQTVSKTIKITCSPSGSIS